MGKREDATINPIVRARESIGMTFSDLVIASKGSVSNLWNAERGFHVRLPRKVISALARAGADVGNIEEEYVIWRAARAREVTDRFTAAKAARG
jgi:hypothetical protein